MLKTAQNRLTIILIASAIAIGIPVGFYASKKIGVLPTDLIAVAMVIIGAKKIGRTKLQS